MAAGSHFDWIEIIVRLGIAALVIMLAVLVFLRLFGRRRQADRASLQAQLDMLAAAIDPEHRKRD